MTSITTLLKNILMLNCYLLKHSLTYETQPEGVYPKDSKFLHPVNEKVIGKMKNEHEG